MKKILILLGLSIFIFSCNKPKKIEGFTYAMNTFINITLYNANEENIEDIKDIYLKYHKLTDYYNEYKDIVNVYTINNSEDFVEVEEDLLEILEISNNNIEGFNILIGELSNMYKEFLEKKDLDIISEEKINTALINMNSSKLIIEENKVKIQGNAKLDLGAISKGFATKKVYEYLKEKNITSYLIDAGSSTVLFGYKEINQKYKAGLKNVSNTAFFKVLSICNKSIGVSGISEQKIELDGKTYTHIVDPNTGKNNHFYDIVVVLADDPLLCDIYSTAFFNLNIDEIKSISKNLNFEVILVKNDSIIYQSDSIKNYN